MIIMKKSIVVFRFPTLATGVLVQIFELMNFRSIDIVFYKIKVAFCQEVKNILHELCDHNRQP